MGRTFFVIGRPQEKQPSWLKRGVMKKDKSEKNISELKIFKHSFSLLWTFMFIGFTVVVSVLSLILNSHFQSSSQKTIISAIFPFAVFLLYYWTWLRKDSKIDILSFGKGRVYITDEYLREEYDKLGEKIQMAHGMFKIAAIFISTFLFTLSYDQFDHWTITFLLGLIIAYLFQFLIYGRAYYQVAKYKRRKEEIEEEAGELIMN